MAKGIAVAAGIAVVASTTGVGGAVLGPGPVAGGQDVAPSCTTSWASARDGDWGASGDWTKGVPGPASVACITVPGDYTVTFVQGDEQGGGATEQSGGGPDEPATGVLVLGAGPGEGSQSLLVTDSCGAGQPGTDFEVGPGTSTVEPGGALVLESTMGTAGAGTGTGSGCAAYTYLTVPSGTTLANKGTISALPGPGGGEGDQLRLEGALVNTGTVDIATPLSDNVATGPGAWVNYGRLDIADGAYFEAADLIFTNGPGGTVVSTGGTRSGFFFDVGRAGQARWYQDGGTTSGAPVVIDSGLADYQGGGASDVDLEGASAVSGTVPPGARLTLGNPGGPPGCSCATTVDLVGSTFTNQGLLTEAAPGFGAVTLLVGAAQTLLNQGRLATQVFGTTDNIIIAGTLRNEGAVSMDVPTYDNDAAVSGQWVNDGPLDIAPGAIFQSFNLTFVNGTGGALSTGQGPDAGIFDDAVDTGVVRWYQEGGATSGRAPVVNGASVYYLGGGRSHLDAEGASHLVGTLAPGQVLTLGNTGGVTGCSCATTLVVAAPTVTNRGRLVEAAPGNGPVTLVVPRRAVLVNSGSLTVEDTRRGAGLMVAGKLVNTGRVRVDVPTSAYGRGTWDNDGYLGLSPAARLDLGRTRWAGGARSVVSFGLSSATHFGRLVSAVPVTLGGRVVAQVAAPYRPRPGTSYAVVEGKHRGSFSSVSAGFRAGYAYPAYVLLVKQA